MHEQQQVQGHQPQPQSRILIVANNPQHYQLVRQFLSHYFPSTLPHHLSLTTKYYSTTIQLSHCPWPEQIHLQEQQQPSQLDKYDMIIMITIPQESRPPHIYDNLIQKHNPDNFILILHSEHKGAIWKDQDVIANEVNNFIEVVREDLNGVVENFVEVKKQGLLDGHYEDGSIYNLIELMETTQWSQIEKISQKKSSESKTALKKDEKPVEEKEGQNHQQDTRQKKEHHSQQNISHKEEPQQPDPQKEHSQPQLTQQQLQQEMANFEAMLSQISNLKAMKTQPQTQNHQQRKQKAESLINQLLLGRPF